MPLPQATQADLADAQGELSSIGKDLTRTVRNKNKLMKWKLDRKAEYQQMKQRCTVLQAQKARPGVLCFSPTPYLCGILVGLHLNCFSLVMMP